MIKHSLRKTVLGTIGSGNVFADLGFPDPETELVKANVVIEIDEAIEKRGVARVFRLFGLRCGLASELT